MTTMRISLLPLSLLLCAATAVAQKANDVVIKKDGARVRGLEVTEFTITGLKAKRGTDDVEIPGHQILGIEWSGLPDAFVAGRAAMDRGDFTNATQLFGDAASKAERPLVRADAEFFKIKAAVSAIGGDKSAASTAATAARSWLDANSTHWRLPEALLLTGRAQRLAGSGADAATTLRDLDDRATRDGFGPLWSARAKFELALTLLADGKGGEARAQFQAASSAADNALANPSADDAELRNLKTQAKVGEGESFLGDKDYAKAESFFRSLGNSDQPELVAAAKAGEGEAIFQQAAANNRPEDLRRAQLALATAAVLDSTGGETSAKANYYLGLCLLKLGADREGDTFKARAQGYFQTVVTHYPSSRWAGLARAELGK